MGEQQEASKNKQFGRRLPYSPTTMAVAGVLIAGGIAYYTFYNKKKRDANSVNTGRVSSGEAHREDNRPRK